MNTLKPFVALMAACLTATNAFASAAHGHNGEDHGLTVPGGDGPVLALRGQVKPAGEVQT